LPSLTSAANKSESKSSANGLEGNGPEFIPTRYRAIGNLRLAESQQPHASLWRNVNNIASGPLHLNVFQSTLVCPTISPNENRAVYEIPWYPSAIWRVDYNSLDCEFLGLLGPGDLIPCLGTYILALLWISYLSSPLEKICLLTL